MSDSETPQTVQDAEGGAYRLLAAEVGAHPWRENGDHPQDNCRMVTPGDMAAYFAPFRSEGEVVRYFRRPDISGDSPCSQQCGFQVHYHGWIDQGPDGRMVCPGDWIVGLPRPSLGGAVAYFPLKPDVFQALCVPVTP
jgi:hypothetical protein